MRGVGLVEHARVVVLLLFASSPTVVRMCDSNVISLAVNAGDVSWDAY